MLPVAAALSLASQFAPSIVKYFTNSDTAGAVAEHVIGIANAVTGTQTPEDAVDALKLDPALALQFKTAVMASAADLEKAYLGDTQNARSRDVELAKVGIINYRANALAAVAVLLVLACLTIVVWRSDASEFAKATITLILGRSLGWVEQMFSFEYGTTRSNKIKDDTINKLSS